MTTVKLTCESLEIAAEPGAEDGPRFRPVIAVNGQRVWHGRPEPTAEDAERVALAYLRYALGGLLAGPVGEPREDAAPGSPPGAAVVTEALEALARDVVGALRRVGDFLERGEWRRFLG